MEEQKKNKSAIAHNLISKDNQSGSNIKMAQNTKLKLCTN